MKIFWAYIQERFPLQANGVLITSYFTANYMLARGATLQAVTPLEITWRFPAGCVVLLFMFFHMRVIDEHKDFERDRVVHPDRGHNLLNPGENPLIAPNAKHVIKGLRADRFPISVKCSFHPWMKGWIRVFNHPYFAVTDENGAFEAQRENLARLIESPSKWVSTLPAAIWDPVFDPEEAAAGAARTSGFGMPELIDGIGIGTIAMGVFGFSEIIRNLEQGDMQRTAVSARMPREACQTAV